MEGSDRSVVGHDDDERPDVAESLALMEATRERARRELDVSGAPISLAWGVAWLVAFGVSYLFAEGTRVLGGLPEVVMALLWPVCIGGAITFQVVYLARKLRGRSGPTAQRGSRLGWVWMAAFAFAVALLPMLGIVPVEAPADGGPLVLWEISMVFVTVVAILLLAEGAAEHDWIVMGVGAWVGSVNVFAALLFEPQYGAVMAVLGGGGFVAAGVVEALLRRRARG